MPLSQLSKLSVIYAEDDSFTRGLYGRMLGALFADLRLAEDGEQALSLYRERRCDLLLTDVQMPNLDGVQLCRQLRQQSPDLPMVILSGDDNCKLLLETINLGIDGYLLKPIDMEQLQKVLLKATDRLLTHRMLQQSARTWAHTFNAIPDLIAILTSDYRIINLNRTAEEKLKTSLSQVKGEDYCKLLHQKDELPEGCLKKRNESGCFLHGNLNPIRLLDGYYNITVAPILDETGQQTGLVHISRDVTDKAMTDQALHYVSSHDQLTGLYNRSWFEAEFKRLSKGRVWPVAIIMADLDGLKPVNDQLGHAAGDRLLARAADVFMQACRADELIARVGGDEFVLLLPGLKRGEAEVVLERIRGHIRQQADQQPTLSISLGMALAESGAAMQDALAEADRLMYQDKRGRKSQQKVAEGLTYRC